MPRLTTAFPLVCVALWASVLGCHGAGAGPRDAGLTDGQPARDAPADGGVPSDAEVQGGPDVLGAEDGTSAPPDGAPLDAAPLDAAPPDGAPLDAVPPDGAPLGIIAAISSLNPPMVHLQALAATGVLGPRASALAPEAGQSFAVSPDGRFLYVLGRRVAAFSIDPLTSSLTPINETVTGLSNWAGITVDPSGRWLIISDNTQGIAVFGTRPDGGVAEPMGAVALGQVASDLTWDPSGKFLFALSCLTDVVARYAFDTQTGALHEQTPRLSPPGAGPARLVFHPSGKTAYLLNIRAQTVTSFQYDAGTGVLTAPETAALGQAGPTSGTSLCYPGHLVVHPSGKLAYATTAESAGSVAIMTIADTGRLTVVGHESYFLFRGADALAIDPTGTFLLVGNTSGALETFRIDPNGGGLAYVTHGLSSTVALTFLSAPK